MEKKIYAIKRGAIDAGLITGSPISGIEFCGHTATVSTSPYGIAPEGHVKLSEEEVKDLSKNAKSMLVEGWNN